MCMSVGSLVAWLVVEFTFLYIFYTPWSLSIEQIALELVLLVKQTSWCRRNTLHSKSSKIIFIKCSCSCLTGRWEKNRGFMDVCVAESVYCRRINIESIWLLFLVDAKHFSYNKCVYIPESRRYVCSSCFRLTHSPYFLSLSHLFPLSHTLFVRLS